MASKFNERLSEIAHTMRTTGEAMMAQMQYSHRNGETEPPTIEGRYWFDGIVDGDTYQGMAIAELYYDELSIWSDTMLGWDRTCDENLAGRWWGPVTPPWGDNA